jgi:hypothetical protein
MNEPAHKVRKVVSRGAPSHQLGHHETQGEKGNRRSRFKVDVQLGEHGATNEALASWPAQVARLESVGGANKADKPQGIVRQVAGAYWGGHTVGRIQYTTYTTGTGE